METSVGCLRKETCRAVSPGLSSVLLILESGRCGGEDIGSACV